MKFKYNFLERKLWRIEDNYFYEVNEENRAFKGDILLFKVGESHILFLGFEDQQTKMTAHYAKTSRNGELIRYEKKINLDRFQIETIFEFTENERINSS